MTPPPLPPAPTDRGVEWDDITQQTRVALLLDATKRHSTSVAELRHDVDAIAKDRNQWDGAVRVFKAMAGVALALLALGAAGVWWLASSTVELRTQVAEMREQTARDRADVRQVLDEVRRLR